MVEIVTSLLFGLAASMAVVVVGSSLREGIGTAMTLLGGDAPRGRISPILRRRSRRARRTITSLAAQGRSRRAQKRQLRQAAF